MRRIMLAGSIFLSSAIGFSVVAGASEHSDSKSKDSKETTTTEKGGKGDKDVTTTTKAGGSTTTTKADGETTGAAKPVKAKASYTG